MLGLELVRRQRQDNDYTRTIVGIPGAVLEVAQFVVPRVPPARSTHMLELVQYAEAPGRRPGRQPTNDVGVAHLALMVTDIHARHAAMAEAGVTFVNPPVEITAGVNREGFACSFYDPDGITLELLQPPAERLRELGITR